YAGLLRTDVLPRLSGRATGEPTPVARFFVRQDVRLWPCGVAGGRLDACGRAKAQGPRAKGLKPRSPLRPRGGEPPTGHTSIRPRHRRMSSRRVAETGWAEEVGLSRRRPGEAGDKLLAAPRPGPPLHPRSTSSCPLSDAGGGFRVAVRRRPTRAPGPGE